MVFKYFLLSFIILYRGHSKSIVENLQAGVLFSLLISWGVKADLACFFNLGEYLNFGFF